MPNSAELQAILDAAERAAAEKNFVQARQRLEEALALQEAELGPSHPDLANTLNNLGVVCERAKDVDEAERCYRRAYAIATAAFGADHPFVETSRQNLADFCTVRGIPFEAPAPSASPPPARLPRPGAAPKPAVADTMRPPPPAAASRPASAPAVRDVVLGSPAIGESPAWGPAPRSRRLLVPLLVGVVAVIAAVGLWLRSGSGSSAGAPSSTSAGGSPPAVNPQAAAPAGGAAGPAAPPPQPVRPPAEPTPPPSRVPQTAPPAAAGAASGMPTVVDAKLCRTLEATGAEWACTPLADPASPGPVNFYTRLRTPGVTTIVHHWYRNDVLQWSRPMQLQANMGAGYRTYSQYTVREPGDWRVELATEDGRVLEQERFTVR